MAHYRLPPLFYLCCRVMLIRAWLHQELLAFTCTYSEMFGSYEQNILAAGQAAGLRESSGMLCCRLTMDG
jgi:hypothetical protein